MNNNVMSVVESHFHSGWKHTRVWKVCFNQFGYIIINQRARPRDAQFFLTSNIPLVSSGITPQNLKASSLKRRQELRRITTISSMGARENCATTRPVVCNTHIEGAQGGKTKTCPANDHQIFHRPQTSRKLHIVSRRKFGLWKFATFQSFILIGGEKSFKFHFWNEPANVIDVWPLLRLPLKKSK